MSHVAMQRPSGLVARNLSSVQPSVPVPIIPYRTGLPALWALRIAGAPRPARDEAAATEAAVFKNSRRETSRSFSIIKTPYDSHARFGDRGGIFHRNPLSLEIVALDTPNLTYDKLRVAPGVMFLSHEFHALKNDPEDGRAEGSFRSKPASAGQISPPGKKPRSRPALSHNIPGTSIKAGASRHARL